MKISGIGFTNHDEAISVLERLTNSLFFQVDLNSGIALGLRRERRRHLVTGSSRSASVPAELNFPKVEYDEPPITLYWYARSAIGMPLLQFLAFYQCVEFYYQTFSQSEAPYSKEEHLLIHDIELLRFIAQQVLIAGSSGLRL